jgi:hypothetical protein
MCEKTKVKTAISKALERVEKTLNDLDSIEVENQELKKEIELLSLELSTVYDSIESIINEFNLNK